jgi:signal recognition particle receptor subunit alpha
MTRPVLQVHSSQHGSTRSSEMTPSKRRSKAKEQRKWGDSAPTESDMASLDFSADKAGDAPSTLDVQTLVDQASLGTRTTDGMYEVKDWEFAEKDGTSDSDFVSAALRSTAEKEKEKATGTGIFGSMFARLTGSKVLTEEDLKPVLEAMKQHLMKKNVAMEISDKVCEGVAEGLVGKKIGGFQSTSVCSFRLEAPRLIIRISDDHLFTASSATNAAFRQALSNSITRILTPKTSTDLLLSIRTKLSSPLPSTQQRMPYSITFVGVNGVGKSTNLSKVCFWLIQNGLRVLIAACDTFRQVNLSKLQIASWDAHRDVD